MTYKKDLDNNIEKVYFIYHSMEFEWDPAKSSFNNTKHGISFEQALEIWNNVTIEVPNIAESKDGETRGATLGQINNKIYVAIWTKRGAKIRLISVRRARKYEEEVYKKNL